MWPSFVACKEYFNSTNIFMMECENAYLVLILFFFNIIPKNLLCDKMENGKMWHVTILRIYRYASSKIIFEYPLNLSTSMRTHKSNSTYRQHWLHQYVNWYLKYQNISIDNKSNIYLSLRPTSILKMTFN